MRHLPHHLSVIFLASTLTGAAAAEETFHGWNLEPGVRQAHLVMVARVSSISRVTVVEGAKTDVALREYRFQPVQILKGIFQRAELSMTAADLGCAPENASSPPPLREGEYRLLILAQQSAPTFLGDIRSYGCATAGPGATTFEQRVPLLAGPDDPLVGVIETLIQVADSRSRRERATLLLDRLADTDGVPAILLLTSLEARADWAAADGRASRVLTRLLGDGSPAVRAAAVRALLAMLAVRGASERFEKPENVAGTLRTLLEREDNTTAVRVAVVESLGYLLTGDPNIDWAREFLTEQATAAATYAERAAAAKALSQIAHIRVLGPLAEVYRNLPLDESERREAMYTRALERLLPDPQRRARMGDLPLSERVILHRLRRSIEARESLEGEIVPLGRMKSRASLPLLLDAAGRDDVSSGDRYHLTWALGQLNDDRAVPVLVEGVRSNNYQSKEVALAALENIDSQVAAQELRPLFKTEPKLHTKLRLARLLARHGFNDGYALATEHLADQGQTAAATLVLVALNDPRTTDDLTPILAAQPDRHWRAAALTALAAVGHAEARTELLNILEDDRHPLIVEAAEAVGLAGDAALVAPLAGLVRSNNQQIAKTSLVAIHRFLRDVRNSPRGLAAANVDLDTPAPATSVPLPAATRAAVADAVAELAVDSYVDSDLRSQALVVARLLGRDGYNQLLTELADQAELEGTKLLTQVQAFRRE